MLKCIIPPKWGAVYLQRHTHIWCLLLNNPYADIFAIPHHRHQWNRRVGWWLWWSLGWLQLDRCPPRVHARHLSINQCALESIKSYLPSCFVSGPIMDSNEILIHQAKILDRLIYLPIRAVWAVDALLNSCCTFCWNSRSGIIQSNWSLISCYGNQSILFKCWCSAPHGCDESVKSIT